MRFFKTSFTLELRATVTIKEVILTEKLFTFSYYANFSKCSSTWNDFFLSPPVNFAQHLLIFSTNQINSILFMLIFVSFISCKGTMPDLDILRWSSFNVFYFSNSCTNDYWKLISFQNILRIPPTSRKICWFLFM